MGLAAIGAAAPTLQAAGMALNGASNLLATTFGVASGALNLASSLMNNQMNAASQLGGGIQQFGNQAMNGVTSLLQAVTGVLQAITPMLQMLGGGGMGANPMASQFANGLGNQGFGSQIASNPYMQQQQFAGLPQQQGYGMGSTGMGSANGLSANSALSWVMQNSGSNLTQNDLRNNMNLYSMFNTGQRLF